MKKEHFAKYGTPNCKSSNPCRNYKYGTPEHSACKNDKWRVCAAIGGSKFCNARQIQAEKSTEPMKEPLNNRQLTSPVYGYTMPPPSTRVKVGVWEKLGKNDPENTPTARKKE